MELTLDQALQKGIEAHKAGKVQEADRYYTAILKANPKHSDANHNMGVLAVGVGKVEVALPFFKVALEGNPKIAQFWLSYIDALIKLDRIADAKALFDKAKSKGAKGDSFNKLEEILSNSLSIDEGMISKKILDKAIGLRESGNYDEAINFLINNIKDFPADPNIPSLLSHCYILNDALDSAIIYLDAAKTINSDIPSVSWNEARLLLLQNKMNEALAVAKKANKLFPNDVEGIGVLGSCLRANGDFNKGLKYLNKAIEFNPNYAEALINRGLIYFSKKEKSNALKDLEKAFYLKPHVRQIWDLLTGLILETKNYSRVIFILIKMIEVDPDHEKSYSVLALCNQQADDPVLAIESFEKILEVKPNDPVTYVKLGLAFNKQNDNGKAIENYQKAISIKPDYADAYYNMGDSPKDQGKLEEAVGFTTKFYPSSLIMLTLILMPALCSPNKES